MAGTAKTIAAFVAIQHALVSSALAWPAITTANVNLRSGPGTGFRVMTTIPDGSDVDVEQCDASGSWCAVSVDDRTGFMSGSYLKAMDLLDEWPRRFETGNGGAIVMHQPQIIEWENYETPIALVATEYQKSADAEPQLGIIEFTADSDVDHDTGEVLISNIKATDLRFNTLDRSSLADLALEIGGIIPVEPITMSLDKMTANLESYQQLDDIKDLKAEAPPIFYSSRPAILLQTDGEPLTAPVEGVNGLSFVVNTNWDLLKIDDTGAWYVRDENSWQTADQLSGPWREVESLPEIITRLPAEDWSDARQAIPAKPYDAEVPKVIFSDRPAELIVTSGVPVLEPVPGTDLQWASNSEAELFFHRRDENWYFLVSGRWFRAPSLDGPWAFATPDLPSDFLKIPTDKPYYTVRASVPGTPESDEARLLASIPEIARIETGSVSATVEYAGEPQFERIEGTDLYYAVNSDDVVIRVGDKYYVVKDGIWFVGDTPEGPFEVARSVPETVYSIPPSSPVYNVTYVRIYDVEPDAVWYGYTSGYLHAYLGWGTIVYGSGWYHRPHWHRWRGHRHPVYFRRHLTFGCRIYYNPLRRAFGRYGFGYGPYRGLGYGERYHWRKHRRDRRRAVYRRDNRRNFISAYNPARDISADRVSLSGSDVYRSWKAPGVKYGRALARERQRTKAQKKNRWRASKSIAVKRKEKLAGRDGRVYRRQGGEWQRSENGTWKRTREANADRRAVKKRKQTREITKKKRATAVSRGKTVKRKQKSHLRRTLDARKANNRRTIQKRTRSAPKVRRNDGKRKKRLLQEGQPRR